MLISYSSYRANCFSKTSKSSWLPDIIAIRSCLLILASSILSAEDLATLMPIGKDRDIAKKAIINISSAKEIIDNNLLYPIANNTAYSWIRFSFKKVITLINNKQLIITMTIFITL